MQEKANSHLYALCMIYLEERIDLSSNWVLINKSSVFDTCCMVNLSISRFIVHCKQEFFEFDQQKKIKFIIMECVENTILQKKFLFVI